MKTTKVYDEELFQFALELQELARNLLASSKYDTEEVMRLDEMRSARSDLVSLESALTGMIIRRNKEKEGQR